MCLCTCGCLHLHTRVQRPEEDVRRSSLSLYITPSRQALSDPPIPPSRIVLSLSKGMYPVGINTKISPSNNDEGSPRVAHHSTPRVEHRARGASVTKVCGVNEGILEATRAGVPAASPGGCEDKVWPLPVLPVCLPRTSSQEMRHTEMQHTGWNEDILEACCAPLFGHQIEIMDPKK